MSVFKLLYFRSKIIFIQSLIPAVMIISLSPIIYSVSVTATIEFYCSVLGFELKEKNDEGTWASLEKDGVGIMVSKPIMNVNFDKAVFTGSFYYVVDDVERLWSELQSKVDLVYPIETFDWGMREFALRDNNGYVLQFGQEA